MSQPHDWPSDRPEDFNCGFVAILRDPLCIRGPRISRVATTGNVG
jgi:hypothetical protein